MSATCLAIQGKRGRANLVMDYKSTTKFKISVRK